MALLSFAAVTRLHPVGRVPRAVLDDVSFEVHPGEVVAIWGTRRSGKTTLLRLAAGVERPDAGSVRLDDRDLAEFSTAERTRRLRQVGYASKEWRAATGKPVVDHVALPLLAEGRPLPSALAKAHEAIEQVGAGGCAEAFAHELPHADLTRIALAQALVREPRLLLVDEPGVTAEAGEREALLRLLRSLVAEREQLAVLLTSRDVAGFGGAQRVLSLGTDGRLRNYEREAQVVPFPGRCQQDPQPEQEPAT